MHLELAGFWSGSCTIGYLGFQTFRLGLELHIASTGSAGCWLLILGLLSLHNYVSQFLIINIFILYYIVLGLLRETEAIGCIFIPLERSISEYRYRCSRDISSVGSVSLGNPDWYIIPSFSCLTYLGEGVCLASTSGSVHAEDFSVLI